MVSPKTLVENPWPWLGRLPEYVRQHTGLSTSGRGPVPPGPPWPSVTLSYHPGPLSFSVTALALHHSRSPPWPSVALGYRPGPPSLSPSVALGHRPGPPLSVALGHHPGPPSHSCQPGGLCWAVTVLVLLWLEMASQPSNVSVQPVNHSAYKPHFWALFPFYLLP